MPVKAGSGPRVTKSTKKDFLVPLSSPKEELAHMTLMFLKLVKFIVRHTTGANSRKFSRSNTLPKPDTFQSTAADDTTALSGSDLNLRYFWLPERFLLLNH
ncbi:hypothetical protein VIM7927_02919 [Vibrio mangrovi]|uniref:Uncharacterized protein n=1 Tax=Vibrio mangrovi TaxID=474394 RepID=A0A1Y6IYP7_9VIBR|nr:hypothetical protein VIM7927_02919 [Vibrio mangrovi]